MGMKSILVVDDSPQIRDGLDALLTPEGYEIVTAEDGEEGLEAAKQRPFDLIIADVNMPKLNGLDMLEKVRETSYNGTTPAFILTTESLKKFSVRFRELGAKIWIVKPYDPVALVLSVSKIIH